MIFLLGLLFRLLEEAFEDEDEDVLEVEEEEEEEEDEEEEEEEETVMSACAAAPRALRPEVSRCGSCLI